MADGGWQRRMADGGWRMADGGWRMADGGGSLRPKFEVRDFEFKFTNLDPRDSVLPSAICHLPSAQPPSAISAAAFRRSRLRRQPTRHDRPAAQPRFEAHAAAVGLDDLVRQREADAGAAGLGRIERDERLAQDVFAHAASGVGDADNVVEQRDFDRGGIAARFVRVFHEVDEHLLDLRAVDEHLGARVAFDVEIVERADIVEDLVPSRELFARRGQARKLRVRLEERAQEREPLVDRLVDFFELFAAVALLREARGVEERADGRDGVVDLMVDDADRFLPDLDFLPAQLRGQALDEDEAQLERVETERPLRNVKRLFLFGRNDDEAVAAGRERVAHRLGELFEERRVALAVDARAAGEELARGDVRVDDAIGGVDEKDRDGRALQDRVEKQFLLIDIRALRAQQIRDFVVELLDLDGLVAFDGGESHAEVSVAKSAQAVIEPLHQRGDSARDPVRAPARDRNHDQPGDRPRGNLRHPERAGNARRE